MDYRFLFEKFVLRQHHFETQVRKTLKRIRGDTFVDVGANAGFYSLLLRRNFVHVFAYEPNPSTFTVLGDRTWRYHNIRTRQMALSDTEGRVPLFTGFRDKGRIKGKVIDGSASILNEWTYKPPNGADDFRVGSSKLNVVCSTFDRQFDGGLHTFDLVKIDVEGAEFLVLKGMQQSLEKERVTALMIELHDRTRRAELENLLNRFGFHLRWVDPGHLLAMKGWQGVLATRRARLASFLDRLYDDEADRSYWEQLSSRLHASAKALAM